jgi:hypothetical protein
MSCAIDLYRLNMAALLGMISTTLLPGYSDRKVANRNVTVRQGRQKMALELLQNPNFRGVRLHVSTGYNRVEGNRRASRNGRVSDLPPETPNVAIRDFLIAVRGRPAATTATTVGGVPGNSRRWRLCARTLLGPFPASPRCADSRRRTRRRAPCARRPW